MKRAAKQFYEFGPFRIETSERLLRRGTDVIPLPPKAVELLLTLVEHGGDAVDKDALLTAVWPGTFVEEGSLAQNVSLLRKVLGDCPNLRYIDTLPRRGYRFVAPVRSVCERLEGRHSLAVLPLVNLSGDHKYVPALYTAFVHASRKDVDQAFTWFERAYEERSNYLIYLGVEPSLDIVRSDPRFADLLRRIGLA